MLPWLSDPVRKYEDDQAGTMPVEGGFYGEGVSSNLSYTVEIASSPTFSSGTVTVSGISATVWSSSPLPDGTYYWRVEAVAPGGGTAGFSSAESFLVDTAAPTSSVGALPSTVVGLSLAVPFTASDPAPGSGVAGVELLYSMDGGHDWAAYEGGALFSSGPISFQAPVPGVYEFQTVAVDRAGNHQAPTPGGQATVTFEPLAVTPNYAPYVFVVSLAALGVIGLVIALMFRRAKGPSASPRPWSEGKTSSGGDEPSGSSSGGTEGP